MDQLATKINEAAAAHKIADDAVQSAVRAASSARDEAYATLQALQTAEHTLLVQLIAQHQSQTAPAPSQSPAQSSSSTPPVARQSKLKTVTESLD